MESGASVEPIRLGTNTDTERGLNFDEDTELTTGQARNTTNCGTHPRVLKVIEDL